jgi:hypothetical protein
MMDPIEYERYREGYTSGHRIARYSGAHAIANYRYVPTAEERAQCVDFHARYR